MAIKRAAIVRHLRRTRKPTLAKKVRKLTKIVNLQKPETKYHDWTNLTPGTTSWVNWSGRMVEGFNQIPQGDNDNSERIGDKLRWKSGRITGQILVPKETIVPVVHTRIVIFQVKKYMDITPVITDLFPSVYIGGYMAAQSPWNWDLKGNAKILADRTFSVQAVGNGVAVATGVSSPLSSQPSYKRFTINYKPTGELKFVSATTQTVGGSVYMAMISSEVANPPSVLYINRLTYTDS